MATSIRRQPEPLHLEIEVDQFAAQSIAAKRVDLRGQPFAVAQQDADSHHAAVYSCSAEAAAFGIEPGMPLFAARRHCPDIAVVNRDRSLEAAARRRLSRALDQWSPGAVVRGHGRCSLDLSGTPTQRAWGRTSREHLVELASRVQSDIGSRSQLHTLAVGVSSSALIARILARQARPHGVIVCPPGSELDELASKSVDLLPGLSRPVREKLRKYGLQYVHQVQRLERRSLVKRFGLHDGGTLYGMVRGVSDLTPRQEVPVITAETVLRTDVNEDSLLAQCVRLTADRLCDQLRRANLLARRLTFRLRHTDNQCVQRFTQLAQATADFSTIEAAARRLFADAYGRRAAIKSMSLSATRPSYTTRQIDLFETVHERKLESLGAAITDIRQRLGFDAVLSGASSHPDLRAALRHMGSPPAAAEPEPLPSMAAVPDY
jgi:DNA polymerase-4